MPDKAGRGLVEAEAGGQVGGSEVLQAWVFGCFGGLCLQQTTAEDDLLFRTVQDAALSGFKENFRGVQNAVHPGL